MPPWSSSFDGMILPRNFVIFAVPRRPRSNSVGAGSVHAACGLLAKRKRAPLASQTRVLLRSAVIEAADQRRAAGMFEHHVGVG